MTRPQLASPLSMVDGSPWRLTMGLHRLDPNEWLEVDERRVPELRAKAALLDHDATDVLATFRRETRPSRELLGRGHRAPRVQHGVDATARSSPTA